MATTNILVEASREAAKGLPVLAEMKDGSIVKQVLLEDYERAGLKRLQSTAEANERIDAALRHGLVRMTPLQAGEALFRLARGLDSRIDVRNERSFGVSAGWEAGAGDWGHRVPTDAWKFSATDCEPMTMRGGAVGDLAIAIPRGVAIRIGDAKESGLFDEVMVVAPVDAFQTSVQVGDPVVLATINRRSVKEEVFIDDDGKSVVKRKYPHVETDPIACFVLAIWS